MTQNKMELHPRLTISQQMTIDKLKDKKVPLVRMDGGFWTYEGCPSKTEHSENGDYQCPDWWIAINTVRVLERYGLLIRTNKYIEEWRDNRVLKEG